MENTRIVHITTVHRPSDPRIFHKQLKTLHEAGCETHLIAPHDTTEQIEGIEVHAISRPPMRVQRLLLQPKVFRTAYTLDADLYQIHDPELIPLAWGLKTTTNARVVYDMHEDYRTKGGVQGRLLRALERWCFGWVDHVLLAEESYRSIVEQGDAPHTRIANYFTPIGDEGGVEIRKQGGASSPSRLLYTGTVSVTRGLRTMVDLATCIKRRDRAEALDLVGICHHDEQRRWVDRRRRHEQLGEVLNWTGREAYVPPSEMTSFYRQADVGLALFQPHPNHVSSMPTKFYEYLHYGLPVICSDFPLWRGFIERHECGAVVSPGEPEAVLDVLDAWKADPEQYRKCVRNALEAARQYRWASMGERLVGLYEELLGKEKA